MIDCAHGAAYKVAPTVLWELGADVIAIGAEPDGFNINRSCGSTDTALLARTVLERGADIGIALDGRRRPGSSSATSTARSSTATTSWR